MCRARVVSVCLNTLNEQFAKRSKVRSVFEMELLKITLFLRNNISGHFEQ